MNNFSKQSSLRKAQRDVESMTSLKGNPRSFFYGDPAVVDIDPADVSQVLVNQESPNDVIEAKVISDANSDDMATRKLAQYRSMSPTDRASLTLLPAVATWNAMMIVNPLLGKIQAGAVNYNLTKSLNEFPYKGQAFQSVWNSSNRTHTVTLTGDESGYVAVPFFRFTIAASTLNAAPGNQVSIDVMAVDAQGRAINTKASEGTHTFQRMSNTQAIVGVYIPFQVVATRTLPFMPVFGSDSSVQRTMVIEFEGLAETDSVAVTIPGYATSELREVARMYNLPAGDIR